MTQYIHPIKPTPDTLLYLGWDPANETFFAQVEREGKEGVEWSVGDFLDEVMTTEALFTHIRRYVPQFQELDFADKLEKDREAVPSLKRGEEMTKFITWVREKKIPSAYKYPFCPYCGELKEECDFAGEKHQPIGVNDGR